MAAANKSRTKKPVGKPSKAKSGGSSTSKIIKKPKAAPAIQQKTKSKSGPVKKKRKVYTEKELGIAKLNMVTPIGVDVPKGKKKGKVFIDDQESMMTILAIVNASKEGQIESKMLKSRHMEEIREARRKESEARQQRKQLKLDETKDSIRRQRRKKLATTNAEPTEAPTEPKVATKVGKKRVAFAG